MSTRGFVLFALLAAALFSSFAPAGEAPDTLRIGVLAHRGEAHATQQWLAHADYLNRRIPNQRFHVVPLAFAALDEALTQGRLDFVITNPGHYVELEHRGLVNRIATLRALGPTGSVAWFGGTAITRADRRDLTNYADLRDKTLLIPNRLSLGGWQAHLREGLDDGIDLRSDARAIIETDNHEAVVLRVLKGDADAGLVRSSILESMAIAGQIRLEDLRVIASRQELGFPYRLSTRLYPEWPIARVKGTSDAVARAVVRALLSMPTNDPAARAAEIDGWDAPASYYIVDEAFHVARIGPYANEPLHLREVLARYWLPLVALCVTAFVLLGVGLGYSLAANRRLRREIALRNKAEQSLEASERRFKNLVFDSTTEGIMITNAQERITLVNPAFSAITGYSQADVLGRTPGMLGSGRHPPEFFAGMRETLNSSGHWQGEIWNRRKSGDIYPVWQSISATQDANGELSGYISLFSDITHLKQSEAQLQHLAYHDALTGLPNRLLFDERLRHAIQQALRRQEKLAVLFFDLDRFKRINDSLGHQVGDELLEAVAQRLTGRLRKTDTIARRGGDEFTVLAESIETAEDAIEIARDINAQLNQAFTLSNGHELSTGCSIGIALFPEHGDDADTLIQRADAAMYQAKASGRGRHCLYDPAMAMTDTTTHPGAGECV
jgi:diguanylate cyclase (GGDEF)-like protein/PAS domain S-box-containing protein